MATQTSYAMGLVKIRRERNQPVKDKLLLGNSMCLFRCHVHICLCIYVSTCISRPFRKHIHRSLQQSDRTFVEECETLSLSIYVQVSTISSLS